MKRLDIFKNYLLLIVFILCIFHILNNYNIISHKTIYQQVLKHSFDRDLELSLLIIGGNHYIPLHLNIFNNNHRRIKHVLIIDDHYSYHPYIAKGNITKTHNYALKSLCKKGFIDKLLLKFKFTHLINSILPLSNVPCLNKLLNKLQYTKLYSNNHSKKQPIYIQLLQSTKQPDENDQQINLLTNNIHLKYSLSLIILLLPEVYGTWITPDMLAYIYLEQAINPSLLPIFYDEYTLDQNGIVELMSISSITMGIISILLDLNLNFSADNINIISFSQGLSLPSKIFKDLIIHSMNDLMKNRDIIDLVLIENYQIQNKLLAYHYNTTTSTVVVRNRGNINKDKSNYYKGKMNNSNILYYNYSTINAIDNSAIAVNHNNSIVEMLKWYISYQSTTIPCESECKRSYSNNNNDRTTSNNNINNNKSNSSSSRSSNNNNNKAKDINYFCFNSGWRSAMEQSIVLTKDCPYVVYTVNLFIKLEKLNKIQTPYINKTCAIAFIHHRSKIVTNKRLYQYHQSTSNWTLIKVYDLTKGFPDTRKASRLAKLSPSLFFSSNVVKYALYIDGKLELKIHPIDYLNTYIYNNQTIVVKDNNNNTSSNNNNNNNKVISMLAIRHPFSISISEESLKILNSLKQRNTVTRYPKLLAYQADYYNFYSINKNISYNNIFDGALLLHNLQSKLSKQFRCMWYEEYQSWADRDQIPGPFAITNTMRLSTIKYPQLYYNMYHNISNKNNNNSGSIFNNIFHKKLEYIPIGYDNILKKFEYIRLLSSNHKNHWDIQHYNIAIQKREAFAL